MVITLSNFVMLAEVLINDCPRELESPMLSDVLKMQQTAQNAIAALEEMATPEEYASMGYEGIMDYQYALTLLKEVNQILQGFLT